MRKHILNSVGKISKLLKNKDTFYDFKSQISFFDVKRSIPVLKQVKGGSETKTTYTVENSDADEFSLDFSGSKETRTIEDSDIDSMIDLSSRITKSLENSDIDEHGIYQTTKTTYTVENSDPDEFVFG